MFEKPGEYLIVKSFGIITYIPQYFFQKSMLFLITFLENTIIIDTLNETW
jgi:hypothetical protein